MSEFIFLLVHINKGFELLSPLLYQSVEHQSVEHITGKHANILAARHTCISPPAYLLWPIQKELRLKKQIKAISIKLSYQVISFNSSAGVES
jgi:hypothetical protein